MSEITLGMAAAFYVRASVALCHGHGIVCGDWSVVGNSVRVGDWPVLGDGVVSLRGVHGLHRYYGSLNNSVGSGVSGLEGWEVVSDGFGCFEVRHRTGSGRMSLWCMSSGGLDSFGVKIHRGSDGMQVAWLKWDGGRWFGGCDIAVSEVVSRMDRFDGFMAIMYDTWGHDVGSMGTARIDETGLFDVYGLGAALREYKEVCVRDRRSYVLKGCSSVVGV